MADQLPSAEPSEQVAPQAEGGETLPQPAKDPNVELQGKLGEFGSYSVDLKPAGDLVGGAEVAYTKDFAGFLKVTGTGKVDVTADLLGGILALAEKSDKLWLKGIATKLRAMAGRA